ncbi:MAG: NADPH-dependent 7-cyano-7-deazaguanine reductase QueF [Deltaproteobacteria bacterium]|nr:MAG: NADPH-dependent 7-cyano-7-deazaguanine reductase QueF [Deltaproteobacteria bacterium]
MSDFETNLPLGKPTSYRDEYDAALLCPFPRQPKRAELGLPGELPFAGFDLWNAYELSWLDQRGKPVVAVAEFRFPCTSTFLIESKSFKLYLNSLNQTRFTDLAAVAATLERDLTRASGAPVGVRLLAPAALAGAPLADFPGRCLDDLDIAIDCYDYAPELLDGAAVPGSMVEETLHSHLLKSNCLVTRQPDWASVLIRYHGPRIDPAALLRYLVSFRRHSEFHEQCVERIFADLLRCCRPHRLTVYARYTRRGGLDINPFRSNFESDLPNWRLPRQ